MGEGGGGVGATNPKVQVDRHEARLLFEYVSQLMLKRKGRRNSTPQTLNPKPSSQRFLGAGERSGSRVHDNKWGFQTTMRAKKVFETLLLPAMAPNPRPLACFPVSINFTRE